MGVSNPCSDGAEVAGMAKTTDANNQIWGNFDTCDFHHTRGSLNALVLSPTIYIG